MKILGKKVQLNLLAQVLTVILSALTISGLDINAQETAGQLSDAIQSQNWTLIGIILVSSLNIGIHWINQLKEDPSLFWQFFRSTNWWVSVLNLVFAIVVMKFGVELEDELAGQIVTLVANADWWALGSLIIANIGNIIGHKVSKSPLKLVKVNAALKAA